MNNVVRVLVLSAIAGGLFNVSANAEQATDNTIQVQSANQDVALNSDAGLNLSDENSDNWWGGRGWGGWGGWGGFGWGGCGGFGWGGWGGWGCGGWGYPYYAYYPWYYGSFGWGGCGGWGWGC